MMYLHPVGARSSWASEQAGPSHPRMSGLGGPPERQLPPQWSNTPDSNPHLGRGLELTGPAAKKYVVDKNQAEEGVEEEEEEESYAAAGPCVVCMDAPREVGFQHGESVHLCVCRKCSVAFKPGTTCPVCRQIITSVVKVYG